MKWALAILLAPLATSFFGQSLYDPTVLYDAPGGLYDKDSLRSLYVDFYDSTYHNALVDSFFTNPSFRLAADVTLNGVPHSQVGVRYKGNATFCAANSQNSVKLPYNIDMNYWVGGQTLMDYKKLKLSNAWPDPTFMKEFAGSAIYRRYMPSYEVNLIKLYTQGNYTGLYSNTESINKQFLEKHFGEKDGTLVKCDADLTNCFPILYTGLPDLAWHGTDSALYYGHYNMKSDHGWGELMDLIHTLNFSPSSLDTILNIDRVAWNFAVNTALLNLDSYNGVYLHNYYLYRTEDGLFQMIPWDVSESFIGVMLGLYNDAVDPNLVHADSAYMRDPHNAVGQRPLLEFVMNDPLYRKQFNAHLRTIVEESMDSLTVRSHVDQMQAIAENAAFTDMNKMFNNMVYYTNVDTLLKQLGGWAWGGIMSSLLGRKTFLQNHQEIAAPAPTVSNLSVTGNRVSVQVFNGPAVELRTTISPYNSKFLSTTMLDDGLNGDLIAGDGIYTAEFPYPNTGTLIKFYIRAQNTAAMTLLPARAEYVFFEHESTVGINEQSTIFDKGILIRVTDILGREVLRATTGLVLHHYSSGAVQKVVVAEGR